MRIDALEPCELKRIVHVASRTAGEPHAAGADREIGRDHVEAHRADDVVRVRIEVRERAVVFVENPRTAVAGGDDRRCSSDIHPVDDTARRRVDHRDDIGSGRLRPAGRRGGRPRIARDDEHCDVDRRHGNSSSHDAEHPARNHQPSLGRASGDA